MVSQVPGLTLADVHAALAYYYENPDAVREEKRAELAAAQSYQADSQSILPVGGSPRRTRIYFAEDIAGRVEFLQRRLA